MHLMKDLSEKVILLTGATGNVGHALLPLLNPAKLICLVHRTSMDSSCAETIRGDIRQRCFGLDKTTFRTLAQRVDWVIHAAASTEFRLQEDTIRRTNVEGTLHAVEFAEAANASFCHVSTAFVRPSTVNAKKPHAYECSKRAAEQIVRASGAPHIILRPSLVVGDTYDGAIKRPQAFHLLLRLWLQGRLPVIPATASAYIDYVPQDVVAQAIALLIRQDVVQGEYWLTAGRHALCMDEFVALCAKQASCLLGRPVAPPKLQSPETFSNTLDHSPPDNLAAPYRELLKCLARGRYINVVEPFPSSLPFLHAAFGFRPLPDPASVLLRNLENWTRCIECRRSVSRRAPRELVPHAAVEKEFDKRTSLCLQTTEYPTL